ncbi:MAG: efflux RND transporter periplasmic adaptor subunit [Steroidobacteraceae bacterium]|nr:efflux RND transporter periplasmic adaptor subunit [Steroidobacteraceae bacterium]
MDTLRSRPLVALGLGLLLAVAGVAGTAWLLPGAEGAAEAPAAPAAGTAPRAAMVVTTARAETATWPAVIEGSGTIAPWQEASVSARATGLPLVAVLAEVGDRVRRGQVLARYDDSTVRTEVARAEAALTQAQAQAEQARLNRDRAVRLRGTGALSQQEILSYETQFVANDAAVAQARAQLAKARLDLEHTRVVAPDAGVITARTASLGAVAQPGTELFRMIRQGRLEWRAELTGTQLAQVKPGQDAVVKLPDGGTVKGRVRLVAPSLDPTTRLGLAYVDLADTAAARASMYVKGEIRLAARQVVTVPSASVVVRDGRSFVATLDGDRARLVPVRPGRRDGERTEIVEGIAAGTPVVVRGAGFLNDRDIVRVAAAD